MEITALGQCTSFHEADSGLATQTDIASFCHAISNFPCALVVRHATESLLADLVLAICIESQSYAALIHQTPTSKYVQRTHLDFIENPGVVEYTLEIS